jgi:hypothetical protein
LPPFYGTIGEKQKKTGEEITMEKLKIYVTSRIADILLKDTEGFEFFKKDGLELNKNAFLTQLVVNYHNQFAESQKSLFDFIRQKMPAAVSGLATAERLDEFCFDLCERLNEQNASPNGEKFDVLLSLKPTKESEPVLDYIEQYELLGRTLSEYFRSMFASYAALPQDKREQIIFKPQYDAVLEAIKAKKKIFITTKKGKKREEVSPYAVVGSKEELHLYVIGATKKSAQPTRLSRIVSVKQLTIEAEFLPEQEYILKKMLRYGPQFIYSPYEKEVMVRLTPVGIEKFKKIYVHRPVPFKVEGDRYYFECSYTQIMQYFVRFGEEAEIVYPKKLREEICRFHTRAAALYNDEQC